MTKLHEETVACFKACKKADTTLAKFMSACMQSGDDIEPEMEDVEETKQVADTLKDKMAEMRGKLATMTSVAKMSDKKEKKKDDDEEE